MYNLRPVKLGVYFDLELQAGGAYQEALNAALLVKDLPAKIAEPIFFTNHRKNIELLKEKGIEAKLVPLPLLRRLMLLLRRRITHNRILGVWRKIAGLNSFERHFADHGVDLVYFLSLSSSANDLEELNYISTAWDNCHRDDMEFPEARAGRIFEVRERKYRSVLPKAVAILVDSVVGKHNLVRRYGIDEERIHVTPLMPAFGTQVKEEAYRKHYIDIRGKYKLDIPYVFYPAQFWAHKNHVYLLEGLRCLEDLYAVKVGAIFSGVDKGNLAHVRHVSESLGLSERIRFIGFVPNEEMVYLYRQCLALVMPTYFGPTNLPPIEAFRLEVPVLYSDKVGLREQVGDAALLMDLQAPESMAAQLNSLIKSPEKRDSLIRKGTTEFEKTPAQDRVKTLSGILKNFQRRMATWG